MKIKVTLGIHINFHPLTPVLHSWEGGCLQYFVSEMKVTCTVTVYVVSFFFVKLWIKMSKASSTKNHKAVMLVFIKTK